MNVPNPSKGHQKNELLQQLVGKPLPTLNSKDMARIRKAPHSQESANILARFRQQELSRKASQQYSEDHLAEIWRDFYQEQYQLGRELGQISYE